MAFLWDIYSLKIVGFSAFFFIHGSLCCLCRIILYEKKERKDSLFLFWFGKKEDAEVKKKFVPQASGDRDRWRRRVETLDEEGKERWLVAWREEILKIMGRGIWQSIGCTWDFWIRSAYQEYRNSFECQKTAGWCDGTQEVVVFAKCYSSKGIRFGNRVTYRKISASLFFLHICKTYVRNLSKASNLLFPEKSGILFYETPSVRPAVLCAFVFFVPPFLSFFLFFRESIVSRTHRRLLLRSRGGVSLLFQSYFSPLFYGKRRKGPLPPNGTGKKG